MIDFKYTQDPQAETPLMFIDKEIGGDESNIQGSDFLKELYYLSDTLGKRKICVMINSPGGIVTEGQSIYSAILNCKADVDTYCYGIAASIAGVIFQAGKKRTMASFANLMYHPAYNDAGTEDKALTALNKSICIMIAERTSKTEDEVWKIMDEGLKDDKGTWMDAKMAKSNGFCDAIDSGISKNLVSTRSIINTYFNKKTIKMNTILNKHIGLNETADEMSAIAVFDAKNKTIEDSKKEISDLKAALNKAEEEMKNMKEAQNKADEEMKAKAKADEEAKAKADAELMDKECETEMKNAVSDGRIKNDAKLIESYKSMYKANPAATKAVIAALPMNKISAVFKIDTDIKDSPAEANARANGLKPGSGAWYNSIQSFKQNIK